jgi:hypothetical protein
MDIFQLLSSRSGLCTPKCMDTVFFFWRVSHFQRILLLASIAVFGAVPCFGQTAPPIISVPSGTLDSPTQVAIAGVTGSTVYLTLDGVTTPTTSSPVYVRPIRVNYSLTIKAIALLGGVSSTVSSATYTLNSVRWPAPNPADASSLKINLQLPTNGIPK